MRKRNETGLEKVFAVLTAASRWIIPVLIIALACTGIFRVNSDEVALILRMGKLVGDTPAAQVLQPGLHFAFPYVIDEVIKVQTGKVHEIVVKTHTTNNGSVSGGVTRSGYLLTGDDNIILVEAAVKYRIKDLVAYALENSDPEGLIDDAVSGALFAQISVMDVDTLLTTGKAILADSVKRAAQLLLDDAACGVTLTGVELTSINPPDEVRDDFEAVNTASVKKQTLVQSANEYRESVLPDAEATAQALIDTAKARQQTSVAAAYSDTAVFEGLLEQYQLSPESVINSYFRKRITQILSRMQAHVLSADEDLPIVLLP